MGDVKVVDGVMMVPVTVGPIREQMAGQSQKVLAHSITSIVEEFMKLRTVLGVGGASKVLYVIADGEWKEFDNKETSDDESAEKETESTGKP